MRHVFSELVCFIIALLHQKVTLIVIQSVRELLMYRQFCMIACELI